ESARSIVESDLAFDLPFESGGERCSVDVDALDAVLVLDPLLNRAVVLEWDRREALDFVFHSMPKRRQAAALRKRSASATFSSIPIPGRDRSGRITPSRCAENPSKSIDSILT